LLKGERAAWAEEKKKGKITQVRPRRTTEGYSTLGILGELPKLSERIDEEGQSHLKPEITGRISGGQRMDGESSRLNNSIGTKKANYNESCGR